MDCQGYEVNFSDVGNETYGIYIDKVNFTTIKNCDINEISGDFKGTPAGIYSYYGNNATIYNNSVYTKSLTARMIKLAFSDSNNITNNNLYSTGVRGYGIVLEAISNDYNIIEENFINTTGGGTSAIRIDAGSYNIIRHNILHTTGGINSGGYWANGIFLGSLSYNQEITNNSIETLGIGSTSIFLDRSEGNNFTNNRLNSSRAVAFKIYGTKADDYNHTIGTDNYAEGKPVLYNFNVQDTDYEILRELGGAEGEENDNSLSEGLVGLWHMNNDWNDSSGYGNNGSINDDPAFGEGLLNKGGVFDGDGDYVLVPYSQSLNFSNTPFSFSMWFYHIDGSGAFSGLVGNLNGASGGGNRMHIWSTDKILMQLYNSTSDTTNFFSSQTISPNKWYHLVYVYNGTHEIYYIDGDFDNSQAHFGGVAGGTTDLSIGSTWEPFNGTIDEVAIWNRSLSAEEIKDLYNRQAGNFGQVICAYCNNVTYNNLTMSGDGISFFLTDDSLVNNSVINTSVGYGVYLYYSNNNTVINTNITTHGVAGYGVYGDDATNTTIQDNVIETYGDSSPTTYTTSPATYFDNTADNIIDNNLIRSNTMGIFGGYEISNNTIVMVPTNSEWMNRAAIGLYGSSFSGAQIKNNYIYINGSFSTSGISLDSGVQNLYFENNTIIVNSTPNINYQGYGIKKHNSGWIHNITFKDLYVTTLKTNSYALYTNGDHPDNLTVINAIFNSSQAPYDVAFGGRYGDGGGVWNFTNVTQADGTPARISPNLYNFTVNVHWYLDANVTEDNLSMDLANVSVWDVNGVSYGSNITNLSRTSWMARFTLLEYSMNSTDTTYYTPYTINASKYTFNTYTNTSVNFTNNIIQNISMTRDSTTPTITYLSPPTNIGEDTSTNITTNVTDNNNFYSFVDDGSLVGWWRMDDYNTTDILDYLGKNNGTIFGNTTPTSNGKWGKALEFDGDGDYVDLGEGDETTEGNTQLTLSVWAKTLDTSETRYIVRQENTVHLEYNSAGSFYFFTWNNTGSSGAAAASATGFTDGNWHHFVGTYNGSSVQIYINGIARDATPGSQTGPIKSTAENLHISRGTTSAWNGTIDNVMIFNRSLTIQEIQALYNSSYQYYRNKTDIPEGDFGLTAYAEDEAGNLASSSRTIVRNFAVGLNTWDLEDDSEGEDGWFTEQQETLPNEMTYFFANYTINNTNSSITSATCKIGFVGGEEGDGTPTSREFENTLVSSEGLVGLWHLNNNTAIGENATKVVDSSGFGNNGTVNGSTWISSGKLNGAFSFNGINNSIIVSDDGLENVYQLTISAWINPGSVSGGQKEIVDYWPTYRLGISSNHLMGRVLGSSVLYGYNIITANNWQHVLLTWDGTNISLWRNGQLVSSNLTSNTSINGGSFRIGSFVTGSLEFWNGSIDEVMIFNRSLKREEINLLYNSSKYYTMQYNSSEQYYYYNRTFDNAGNYTWTINCSKTDYENLAGTGELRVRIPQYNQSSLGKWTNKYWVNYNENLTINITIPDEDIDQGSPGYDISNVYAEVTRSDGQKNNVTLSNLLETNSIYDEGLVGLWHLNNDSNYGENDSLVYDFSGNGNNGTVINATFNRSGKVHGGYSFDGDGDYVLLSTKTYPGEFTLSSWINSNIPPGLRGTILGDSNTDSFGIDTDGKIIIRIAGDTNSVGNTVINNLDWYHIVVRRSSDDTLECYINGINDTGSLLNSSNTLEIDRIGAMGSDRYFNGTIDEVAIWNRSLTAEEILELYQSSDKYQGTYPYTTHEGVLGDYNVKYYANLTNGFNIVKNVSSNFTIQNTTIQINIIPSVNTTDSVNVNGQINRNNGSDSWNINNNLFIMKINNVTVSSDTYNYSTFSTGTADEVNATTNSVRLNLTTVGSPENYTDNYTSSDYMTDSYDYYNAGYDDVRDVLFSLDQMTGNTGNVTYHFTSLTKFYNVNITARTYHSSDNSGGNTSIYYSLDNSTWTILNSTTSLGTNMTSTLVVNGNQFFVKIESNVAGGKENPLSEILIDYTQYEYSTVGSYTSSAIYLDEVTYTVLRWDESGTSEVSLQLRESDDGIDWGSWSNNYTNPLNNDISGYTKDYIQYKAWLTTTNVSITPVLYSVNISYFNASTNSSGGYSYNITIPTDTLGTQPIEVAIINNPATGINGTNYTNVDVWARTNVTYNIVTNYSKNGNYSVTVNYTRTDIGEFVNGTINITLTNLTGSVWSQDCTGSRCTFSWIVPTELKHGNYTINISGSNESAYYLNITRGYYDYLEEANTTGTLYVNNKTIGDFSAGNNYTYTAYIEVNNTGNATLRNVNVYKITPPSSTYVYLKEIQGCNVIYPNETCNVLMNVTLRGDATTGNHQISWRANWTNNDGTIGPMNTEYTYISFPYMYIYIAVNASMEVNETSFSTTTEHGNTETHKFKINSTGTDTLSGIYVDYTNTTLPTSWITITPQSVPNILPQYSYDVTINVSVPLQTSPGNYTGTINITSTGGYREIVINVTVPENKTWQLTPATNYTYNRSYPLNTPGEIANYTIANTGNLDANFLIDYDPTGTTDYTAFGTTIFEENYNIGFMTNPTSKFVSKGTNETITLYSKGYGGGELDDIGVKTDITYTGGTPSFNSVEDSFHIYEAAPSVQEMWILLDGINGSKAELYQNVTIKFRGVDDVDLKETGATINITYSGITAQRNATSLRGIAGEYEGDPISNYTANYTPTSVGTHTVFAKVYDEANNYNYSNTYSFTVYGITTINLLQNTTETNITNVDQYHKAIIYINYSINNTGEVKAYTPNLTFVKNNTAITISPPYKTFSNLQSNKLDSEIFQINISELTLPGQYNITSTVEWTNPSTGKSTDTTIFSINVRSNKSLAASPSNLEFTVPSNADDSKILTINNTGNTPIQNINLTCTSGSLCTNLLLSDNSSLFNLGVNGTITVNVTLSAIAGTAGGAYTGKLNITDGNTSTIIDLSATVPETYSWTASPLSINRTIASSQTGELEEIHLQNTGNMNLTISLSSTNNSIVQPNQTSIIIGVNTNTTFMINYTTPNSDREYFETIKMDGSGYNPEQINVTINLTVTQINITILHPTTSNNISNISIGDIIEAHVNATYNEQAITNDSTFNVTLEGTVCNNINSNYSYSLGFWNITCNAPQVSDGETHNLTITLIHDTYGEITATSYNSVIYKDATPPYFNIIRNNIDINDNINLQANITDNTAIDNALAYVIYPNSTQITLTLTETGGYYRNTSQVLREAGEYLVNYTAEDTSGNTNSTIDWFETYDRYYWNLKMLNYDNTPIANMNLTLYRPNTTTILANEVTNSTGEAKLYVNKRFYDFQGKITNHYLKIKEINFTNLTQENVSINFYKINGEDLEETVPLYKLLVGIASNSTGLSTNTVSLIFNYSGQSYDNPTKLEIIKCPSWNYTGRECLSTWSLITSLRNVDARTLTGNSSGFSAYFLSENMCGNGLCETTYAEDTTTCPSDCSTGTTTIISGGGGGGGGGSSGLSASDLERIEQIVKSFLEIGGVKLETTSVYKELFAGDTTSFRIKLKNTLATPTTITMETQGDIKNMIFFETTNIELKGSEEKNVIVKVMAPKLIEPGNYDGNIILKSGEEEGEVPVTIRILAPEGKLLDVKIQPLTPTVPPGGTLRLQTDLLNLGKTKKIDVQFDIQLIDVETGETITRTEEAFAVETTISTVKNLTIPEDTKPGRYMVKATAYYSNIEVDGSMQASSIAYVTVAEPILLRSILGIKVWMYLIFLAAILFIAGLIIYLRWMRYKKKRFKVKVDLNKLPQPSSHSGFIGKIAESGIRAFIDLNKLQMHTLIAGATGSGKTVAAQSIIEAALLHKKSVIVFDPTAQWTGFLRKCTDKSMLKRYKYFEMKTKDTRAFDGVIKTINDPYERIHIKDYLNNPGQITIFNISHLTPKEIDLVVASTIQQIFESEPEESKELNTMIVYDEVHRLLPKFGGSGEGFIQLERGAREFRKWGIGLMLISQVLSDFVGEIKANIGTEIQMGTRYEGDLERVNMKYGEDILKSVVKEPIGTGMTVNAEYNNGKPYFIAFRPLLHSTKRLTNTELEKYEKYFQEIEDIEYQTQQLKKLNVDVLDLELEIKLTKQKIKEGQFQMADMYFESLKPRLEEQWKRLKKKPMHKPKQKIKREEVMMGVSESIKQRKEYEQKNPKQKITFQQDLEEIKKELRKVKKKNEAKMIKEQLTDIEQRIKPYKGSIPQKDAEGIKKELQDIKDNLKKIKNT